MDKKCERADKCPFFNEKMANMPATANLIKKRYCLDQFEKCARYIAAQAKLDVPVDLFPNDREKVKAKCERAEKCPFFNEKMANMPATANLMKKRYCFDAFTTCARYIVFKAGLSVPIDLFPHDTNKSEKIIGNGKIS